MSDDGSGIMGRHEEAGMTGGRGEPVRLESIEGRNISLPASVAAGLPAARRALRDRLRHGRSSTARRQEARVYTAARAGRAIA